MKKNQIGRKIVSLALLIILSACTHYAKIDLESFERLDVGMSWPKVQALVGSPVEIQKKSEGNFVAIYLEREGEGRERAWKYTLTFENHVLCFKDMEFVEKHGPDF